MPDPERVVSRSVGMLMQLGYDPVPALHMVAVVARRACADLARIFVDDLPWLEAIADAAERRLPVPDPKVTDH